MYCFIFFFQAEDGIRDISVTGVQTCALPISYVPASDTFIEKDASINEHIEQMRLSATKALLERRDTIIVATVSAIYGLGDPKSYHGMILHLRQGATMDQREIGRAHV